MMTMFKSSRVPWSRRWLVWAAVICFSGLGIVLLRLVVLEGFEVPSGSMLPTLRVGDSVWVNKTAYGISWPWDSPMDHHRKRPQRGDIVVFVHPKTHQFYVKRVIAFPGEAVMIIGHRIWVNGEPLEAFDPAPDTREMELWGSELGQAQIRWATMANGKRYRILRSTASDKKVWSLSGYWVVPERSIFVVGDWRDESSDSRSWGALPIDDLVGQVVCIRDGGVRRQNNPIPQRSGCSLDEPLVPR